MLSHWVIVHSNKVTLKPYPLKAEQTQLPQLLLIRDILQSLTIPWPSAGSPEVCQCPSYIES